MQTLFSRLGSLAFDHYQYQRTKICVFVKFYILNCKIDITTFMFHDDVTSEIFIDEMHLKSVQTKDFI